MSRDVTALEAKAKELLEMVELPVDLRCSVRSSGRLSFRNRYFNSTVSW